MVTAEGWMGDLRLADIEVVEGMIKQMIANQC